MDEKDAAAADESAAAAEVDNFKPVFKRYKSKSDPPDLAEARQCVRKHFDRVRDEVSDEAEAEAASGDLGLKSPTQWEVYRGRGATEGLVLARNVFTKAGQVTWADRCLRRYARCPPNKTNLGPDHRDWFEAALADAKLVPKLRWATLGYHHNWDTKVYSEDDRTDFPEDLGRLSSALASVLVPGSDFSAEAAIVNFYPPGSTLGPHTDHSEPNASAPLLSVSLGRDAVFLFGGATRAHPPPTPLLLRSGDALFMTGTARKCFHAVPLICTNSEFEEDENPHKRAKADGPEQRRRDFVQEYLRGHRINMNVRQVH